MNEETTSLISDEEEAQSGFGLKTVLGVLFLGLVVLPGAIYLSLVAGRNIGPAAEWVTVMLFAELARRSFKKLRRQEIFVLFYAAGNLMIVVGGIQMMGGPFGHLIWNQFVGTSEEAHLFGIASELAEPGNAWIAPFGSAAIKERLLIHPAWFKAITVTVLSYILIHLNRFGLGFLLFKLTSDREKLSFPLAYVGAAGSIAIAESFESRTSSMWRYFSTGIVMGIIFGGIYVVIPSLSGAFLRKPIVLIPIPWIDFCGRFSQNRLPAGLLGINTDPGALLVGMVLPFQLVAAQFVASIASHLIANPWLYKFGILKTWRPGMTTIPTSLSNNLDFWLSFSIGIGAVVFLIGLGQIVFGRRREGGTKEPLRRRAGDIPVWLALAFWVGTSLGYITLTHRLVPRFPLWLLFVFAFGWTPLYSYIEARMVGITGRGLGFPMIREGSLLLSRYRGANIWFAPIPLFNHGMYVQTLKVAELTKTRITSLLKAELFMIPVVMACSLAFWAFLWRLQPIPSPVYVYAAKIWPLRAQYQVLWASATTEGGSRFMLDAIRGTYILAGTGVGLLLFAVLKFFQLPLLIFFGAVSGLGMWGWPHASIPMFAGALLGRYVFQKKFGREVWRKMILVVTAGYTCGMGLMGMFSAAVAMISKAVIQLPY